MGDDVGPRSLASASASTSTFTFSIELDDEPCPLFTCFLNHPTNTSLSQSTNTSLYQFHDLHLLCFFVKNPGDTWHIAIPTSLLDPIINS